MQQWCSAQSSIDWMAGHQAIRGREHGTGPSARHLGLGMHATFGGARADDSVVTLRMGHHEAQRSRRRLPDACSLYGHPLRAMVHRIPTQVAGASVLARPVHPIPPTDGKEPTVATRQGPSRAQDSWTRAWVWICLFGPSEHFCGVQGVQTVQHGRKTG